MFKYLAKVQIFSIIQLSDVTDYNKNLKNPFCVVKAVAF